MIKNKLNWISSRMTKKEKKINSFTCSPMGGSHMFWSFVFQLRWINCVMKIEMIIITAFEFEFGFSISNSTLLWNSKIVSHQLTDYLHLNRWQIFAYLTIMFVWSRCEFAKRELKFKQYLVTEMNHRHDDYDNKVKCALWETDFKWNSFSLLNFFVFINK